MEKLVSIVVPIYNMGHSVISSVQSLLNQSYRSIEIILIDDGSTDDTYQQCLLLASQDNRIKVKHTENKGSGPARNEGIFMAKGDYLYFPDADDIIAPDAITILVNTIEASSADLIVFGYRQINHSGKLLKEKTYCNCIQLGDQIRQDYANYISTETLYSIQGAPWNKFFKTSIINQYNILFPPLRRHQDECFISKYMCHVRTVQFIDSILYTYTVNGLGDEWKKYPVDYIDSVNSLYLNRTDTILKWNNSNTTVREMVYREYICMFTKAMELSFAPKMQFNYKKRYNWISEQVQKSFLKDMYPPAKMRMYHKILFKFFQHRYLLLAIMCMCTKINIQKTIQTLNKKK